MSKLLINISSKLFISLVLCCNFASFSKQRTCTLVSVCSKSSQTLLKLTHFSRLILWKHFLHSLFCVFNSSHSLVGIDTTFSQYFSWEHWLTEVQCFSRRIGIVWMCHLFRFFKPISALCECVTRSSSFSVKSRFSLKNYRTSRTLCLWALITLCTSKSKFLTFQTFIFSCSPHAWLSSLLWDIFTNREFEITLPTVSDESSEPFCRRISSLSSTKRPMFLAFCLFSSDEENTVAIIQPEADTIWRNRRRGASIMYPKWK